MCQAADGVFQIRDIHSAFTCKLIPSAVAHGVKYSVGSPDFPPVIIAIKHLSSDAFSVPTPHSEFQNGTHEGGVNQPWGQCYTYVSGTPMQRTAHSEARLSLSRR